MGHTTLKSAIDIHNPQQVLFAVSVGPATGISAGVYLHVDGLANVNAILNGVAQPLSSDVMFQVVDGQKTGLITGRISLRDIGGGQLAIYIVTQGMNGAHPQSTLVGVGAFNGPNPAMLVIKTLNDKEVLQAVDLVD
jgi:hypothetical protein